MSSKSKCWRSFLAFGTFALMPMSAPAFAPAQLQSTTPNQEPETCREVLAIALQSQGSLYWYRPRVLDVAERYLPADLDDLNVQASITSELQGVVPVEPKLSVLSDRVMQAIAIAQDDNLCVDQSRLTPGQ